MRACRAAVTCSAVTDARSSAAASRAADSHSARCASIWTARFAAACDAGNAGR